VVLLNTQELPAITEAFSEQDMLQKPRHAWSAGPGQCAAAGGEGLRGHHRSLQDEALLDELEDWAQAARTVQSLRQAVIGGWGGTSMAWGILASTRLLSCASWAAGPAGAAELAAEGQESAPEDQVARAGGGVSQQLRGGSGLGRGGIKPRRQERSWPYGGRLMRWVSAAFR